MGVSKFYQWNTTCFYFSKFLVIKYILAIYIVQNIFIVHPQSLWWVFVGQEKTSKPKKI